MLPGGDACHLGREAGGHDDGKVRVDLLERLHGGQPVHAGHPQIGDRCGKPLETSRFYRGRSIVDGCNIVALLAQLEREYRQEITLIVNDEDPRCR